MNRLATVEPAPQQIRINLDVDDVMASYRNTCAGRRLPKLTARENLKPGNRASRPRGSNKKSLVSELGKRV